MPENWRSSRTIWVKREEWDFADSARGAKSEMATRGLLVSPRPVPARNHPSDWASAGCAVSERNAQRKNRRDRLNAPLTFDLRKAALIETVNRFISLAVVCIREIPKNGHIGRLPVVGKRWKRA